ncbi:MOSC domain-containing protein [Aquamicrobium ahrensii]|uniref:Uncharacterized protein YcbX n=1 Tax=Aquamicrobium ahrensii TaxID=469551 RepID=A0ABV2KMR0_9HYPH
MADIGHVAELWRYPASSLGGEMLPALDFGLDGADGDRCYGLIDTSDGEIARPDRLPKWRKAPRIAARLDQTRRLEVMTPGGEWLAAPGADSQRAVSDYLGFGAAILPFEGENPAGYDGPHTRARYEKAPVHLLTTASLARLKALHPDGVPDRRRFRPSILIETPEVEGHFPETEWIGRRLSIGDLELSIVEPCRRCGFTIISQEGVPDDPGILRTLVRHNAHNIGVYCRVEKPARLRAGDAIRLH